MESRVKVTWVRGTREADRAGKVQGLNYDLMTGAEAKPSQTGAR
jgi:hypothetical protein